MTRYAFLALFAIACNGEKDPVGSGDTAGTTGTTSTTTTCADGRFNGPTTLQQVTVTCAADGASVRFFAETEGWTDGGWVYSQDSANEPDWSDTHDLDSYEFDACGFYDRLERTVTTGAAVGAWAVNTSTVFTCADHFNDVVMTYAFGVKDVNGALVDCLAFGSDVADVVGGVDAGPNVPGFNITGCEEGTPTM